MCEMIGNGLFIIRFGVEHKNAKCTWYITKNTIKDGKENADFVHNLQKHVLSVYCFELLILLLVHLNTF